MKKIIAVLLCILMLAVAMAPAVSAISVDITDTGAKYDFETVFETKDITGVAQIKFDYRIETTNSVGPGWNTQSFGLFDEDGKFIQTWYHWPSGSVLIPHDAPINADGVGEGTAVWNIPATEASKFDFSKVCEFDGYLWGSRICDITITNLRAVMPNGSEILLSQNCEQAADEDQVSLYNKGDAVTNEGAAGVYDFTKTWTFDEPMDISLRSYVEFDVSVVPHGTTTKLAEGPGYYKTSLTLTDDEGNTFVTPDVLVHDARGYMSNHIWAEAFTTECETFDFTSVVSATLYASCNRIATYYFNDITFGTSESGLDTFGELLGERDKGPDDARIVMAGSNVDTSFEYAFEKTDFSTAYAIAYDYNIVAISDSAPAPAYHWAKAAIFDSNGNFNEWTTNVLPNNAYGSGTITTPIPRIGNADLRDICEFNILISITQTAIYTIDNLRLVDSKGNTVKMLEHTGYDNLVSFKGEGEGKANTFVSDSMYSYDETVVFTPVDLSKYGQLRFTYVVAQESNPHNKLSAGPGYHSQSVKIINAKGEAIELTDAIQHDARGKNVVSILLNDKEFDYSCVNAIQITLMGNRSATYWIESVEAMNSKYKWYSMEEIHELEVNPPVDPPATEDNGSDDGVTGTDKPNNETNATDGVTENTADVVEDTTSPAEDDGGWGKVIPIIAGGLILIGAVVAIGFVALRKKKD